MKSVRIWSYPGSHSGRMSQNKEYNKSEYGYFSRCAAVRDISEKKIRTVLTLSSLTDKLNKRRDKFWLVCLGRQLRKSYSKSIDKQRLGIYFLINVDLAASKKVKAAVLKEDMFEFLIMTGLINNNLY